jgi:hypothetical protein
MISERKYIYPEALDFSWIMAVVPEVTKISSGRSPVREQKWIPGKRKL